MVPASLLQPAQRRLESALLIRPGEARRTALLFAQLLAASAIFILGRTVRDTLFLSVFPMSALPWMFVAYGATSAVVATVYARYADRLPRHRMLVTTVALGAASYLGTWVLVRAELVWVLPIFYVWSEVVANLFLVQFWTSANELFDPRAAKRLFGVIGAARVLGVILIGTSAGAIVKLVGTAQLLFVLVALMVLMTLAALALRREPHPEGPRSSIARGPAPAITKNAYARGLALMILLAFVALTVGDYQFKAIARSTYTGDDLARFFALFYAVVGVGSFVFQIVVTPRLLRRFGVGVGMSVMPAVFGLSSAALLGWPVLGVASVMKSADNGLQYTVHETTLQALYVPFAANEKARVRALLEAVVKPGAYGVGGLVLALFASRLDVTGLGALTLGVVAAWLGVVPLVRRRYQRALEHTLTARGDLALDAEFVLDAQGRELLLHVAESADPRHALAAFEQLEGDDSPRLVPAIERLLREGDAAVRRAAYGYLAALPGAPAELAKRGLEDRDPEARAEAANAYARLAGDDAVETLLPYVDDPATEVRSAALAGLLRDGGVEGSIAAGARLAQLLASPGREERLEAAHVLGELGPGAFRPVARLLDDADAAVRRAALRACSSVVDPRLAPALCSLLADPSCRNRARTALAAIGLRIVPLLVERLRDPKTPRAARLEIPRVLRGIATPESYKALRSFVDDPDGHIRLRVYAAMSKLRASLGLAREPAAWLEIQLRRELVEGLGIMAGWEAARDRCATPLFVDQMRLYEARLVRRVLRLLELRHEPGPMRLLRQTVEDPKRRTNALEALDNAVGTALRSLVMPLFDDAPARDRLAAVGGREPLSAEGFLRNRAASPNPFTVLLLLDALSAHRDPLAPELSQRALGHADPLVREAAVLELARASAEERAARASEVEQLLADPDHIVARLARAELSTLAPREKEATVRSTVEKIVVLKSTPVFEKIASEDLAPLARVATEELYPDGARIFAEGDHGDSLYVVVRGKVRIIKGADTLAELGPGEAFGEMAVLDAAPRSGDALCVGETEVLRIGSEEFYEILHEQVELAEGIIRMLVRRLRGAAATSTEEQQRNSLIVS